MSIYKLSRMMCLSGREPGRPAVYQVSFWMFVVQLCCERSLLLEECAVLDAVLVCSTDLQR